MMAVELRPPDLDILGLAAALREHFRRATVGSSLKIHFTDTTQRATIAQEAQTVLFRTAQECLNNVIRHAHARHVRFRLSVARRTLLLCISDDGKGFDPAKLAAKPGAHMGLRAIQEMVASVGGKIVMKSKARQGTRLDITIPQDGTPS